MPADFLWGVILPGGSEVLQMTAGGLAPGSLNNLAGLHPVFSNLTVPGGFAQKLPDFFTYTLTGGEPPGSYRSISPPSSRAPSATGASTAAT